MSTKGAIHYAGKNLRLLQVLMGALKAKGRSEDDLFLFIKDKHNVDLFLQQIMKTVPFLTVKYKPEMWPEIWNKVLTKDFDGDIFIYNQDVRLFLLEQKSNIEKNSTYKEEQTLLFYRINLKTFFGKVEPYLERIEVLYKRLGFKLLTLEEVLLFRYFYNKQPPGERLLMGSLPAKIFSGGNEVYLSVKNTKPNSSSLFKKNIGYNFSVSVEEGETEDIIFMGYPTEE